MFMIFMPRQPQAHSLAFCQEGVDQIHSCPPLSALCSLAAPIPTLFLAFGCAREGADCTLAQLSDRFEQKARKLNWDSQFRCFAHARPIRRHQGQEATHPAPDTPTRTLALSGGTEPSVRIIVVLRKECTAGPKTLAGSSFPTPSPSETDR